MTKKSSSFIQYQSIMPVVPNLYSLITHFMQLPTGPMPYIIYFLIGMNHLRCVFFILLMQEKKIKVTRTDITPPLHWPHQTTEVGPTTESSLFNFDKGLCFKILLHSRYLWPSFIPFQTQLQKRAFLSSENTCSTCRGHLNDKETWAYTPSFFSMWTPSTQPELNRLGLIFIFVVVTFHSFFVLTLIFNWKYFIFFNWSWYQT